MKNLTTAAVLIGGAILASQSAFAQTTFVQNDLYLGFQNQAGGGSADYVINLGAASGIVGSSTVVDFSSDFSLSLFDDVSLQGTSSQIYAGVVGGENSSAGGGTADIFATQLRTSNIGNWAVAGSSLTATAPRSQDNNAETTLAQLYYAPGAGTGVLDSSKPWENYIEPANSSSTFLGAMGINPDSFFSPSTVLYEDLYETQATGPEGSGGYTYQGYFTLDLTGQNPSLTFTPQAVPEPTVFGLLGGAGFLLLSFRHRFNNKKFAS